MPRFGAFKMKEPNEEYHCVFFTREEFEKLEKLLKTKDRNCLS